MSPREGEALADRMPTPGAPEKDAVRSMFDRIAARYDSLIRLLSAGADVRWRAKAVDFLALRRASCVLDLCTGTADLLIEALSRDGEGRGIGVDLSFEMLRRGQSKLARRGPKDRSALVCGDGERLPFADASFDGALIAFGIRNIGASVAVLREFARVLRAGGPLVVLEFGMPRGLVGKVYGFYFQHVLPRIGGLISGEAAAYAYLPASVAALPSPEAFGSLMEQAGFSNVTRQRLTGGIAHLYRGEKGRRA